MTQTIIKLFADGAIIPLVGIAGYALLFLVPKGHKFEAYARIVMAGLTSYLLAKLLASVYQPVGERPFLVLGVKPDALYLNNPGFPSDHALFATFLTLAVWFETKRKDLTIIMALLTLAICIARVLALVHTPLDIIGGIVVASVGSIWYLQRSDKKQPTTKSGQKHKKPLQ